MSKATVFHIDEAPRSEMRYGRGTVIQLINESIGARNVDVHVNVLRPGSAPGPYHYHEKAENIYIILSGVARIIIEGEEHIVGPEQVVFIPAGLKHSTSNAGQGSLKLIEMYAPLGKDFHEVEEPEK